MRNATVLCGAAILALAITNCSRTAPDTREADVQALKDNEAGWNREWASKDPAKLVAHYADDAVLMAPGMPPSSGKDAIRKVLQELVADPALSLKFVTSKVEVARSGDVAFTQGSYTMAMTDPLSKQVVNDRGSYVTTYRKQDGSWKAVADIASSEAPPAAPPSIPAKK